MLIASPLTLSSRPADLIISAISSLPMSNPPWLQRVFKKGFPPLSERAFYKPEKQFCVAYVNRRFVPQFKSDDSRGHLWSWHKNMTAERSYQYLLRNRTARLWTRLHNLRFPGLLCILSATSFCTITVMDSTASFFVDKSHYDRRSYITRKIGDNFERPAIIFFHRQPAYITFERVRIYYFYIVIAIKGLRQYRY